MEHVSERIAALFDRELSGEIHRLDGAVPRLLARAGREAPPRRPGGKMSLPRTAGPDDRTLTPLERAFYCDDADRNLDHDPDRPEAWSALLLSAEGRQRVCLSEPRRARPARNPRARTVFSGLFHAPEGRRTVAFTAGGATGAGRLPHRRHAGRGIPDSVPGRRVARAVEAPVRRGRRAARRRGGGLFPGAHRLGGRGPGGDDSRREHRTHRHAGGHRRGPPARARSGGAAAPRRLRGGRSGNGPDPVSFRRRTRHDDELRRGRRPGPGPAVAAAFRRARHDRPRLHRRSPFAPTCARSGRACRGRWWCTGATNSRTAWPR